MQPQDYTAEYCQYKKTIGELKATTAGRRGELKRSISDSRNLLLVHLDQQPADAILFRDGQLAIKRCVCESYTRLQPETVVEAFRNVYNWDRVQPFLEAEVELSTAVRLLLKVELKRLTRRVKEYGDVVPTTSKKFRTRVAVDDRPRIDKVVSTLPGDIAEIVTDMERCTDELTQLAAAHEGQIGQLNDRCEELEATVVQDLKQSKSGKSAEYEFPTDEAGRPLDVVVLAGKPLQRTPCPGDVPEGPVDEGVPATPPILERRNYTSLPSSSFEDATTTTLQHIGQVRRQAALRPPVPLGGGEQSSITHRYPYSKTYTVRYHRKTTKPTLSVCKVDLSVGSELQRYLRNLAEQHPAQDGQLPRVSMEVVAHLVDKSIGDFLAAGTEEVERLSLRKKKMAK